VFGPRQIVNRINQNTEIARQVSLWDQRGSQVIRGDLLVIPIEESVLYVQPLYLRAEGGRIPELKRVIVAYQNNIVMDETLSKALERIMPAGAAKPRPEVEGAPAAAAPVEATQPSSAAAGSLAEQARAHYSRALQAQRDGNWALYGEEIKKLGDVLKKLP
jgi:uncharacterized protein